MSSRRKAQRRLEIEAVRENAREAFAVGKSRESCPYRYCDEYQWKNEWDRLAYEQQQEEREMTQERDDYMRRQEMDHDLLAMRDPLGQRFGRALRSTTPAQFQAEYQQAPPLLPAATHDLKVHSRFWDAFVEGRNTHTVRRDDRNYRVNDILLLRAYDPAFGYTGQSLRRRVTYISRNEDMPQGISLGWCVMSLAEVKDLGDPI